MDSDKLVREQHIIAILSIGAKSSPRLAVTNCIVSIACKIVYFLRTRPITREFLHWQFSWFPLLPHLYFLYFLTLPLVNAGI